MIVGEDGRRCRRNGTGAPPICQADRQRLGIDQTFRQKIDDVIAGRVDPRQVVQEAAHSIFESLLGRKLDPSELPFDYPPPGSASSSHSRSTAGPSSARSRSQAPSDHAARDQARRIGRARRTLGFSAKEPLTRELLKTRFRELAKKHHPDRPGGSTAKMAEINAAMEVLLESA